jgi:DNA modification methylase
MALAAVKLGRQFLGIERNEEYVRLAVNRIAAALNESV